MRQIVGSSVRQDLSVSNHVSGINYGLMWTTDVPAMLPRARGIIKLMNTVLTCPASLVRPSKESTKNLAVTAIS